MANILNIDTSSKFCSIGISKEGETIFGLESSSEMDHSKSLATFVKQAIEFLNSHDLKLEGVCVIAGPGSYTGLRIGMSMAKGLCYSLDIPLITVSALEVLAVRAIFTSPDFNGDEIIIPLMDAGRMEVYTAVFDSSLKEILKQQPLILNSNSFDEFKNHKKIILIGDGADKFQKIYQNENAEWMVSVLPHAKFMSSLAEKYYREKRFSDIAYSKPHYLKEYLATKSKNRL